MTDTTLREAIIEVMTREGEPMHYRAITEGIKSEGLGDSDEATAPADVKSAITIPMLGSSGQCNNSAIPDSRVTRCMCRRQRSLVHLSRRRMSDLIRLTSRSVRESNDKVGF